jgi:probable rRNA maturation factor
VKPRLALDVTYASRRPWVPSARQFSTWAAAALLRSQQRCALSVRVVGRVRSQRLNGAYRGRNKPTNVLSFAGAGPLPDGSHDLGELVICAPLVAAEALAQRKKLPAHWAHLTVHGVLHLCGFDHEHEEDAVKMETQEVQILDRLGFSDPYRRSSML